MAQRVGVVGAFGGWVGPPVAAFAGRLEAGVGGGGVRAGAYGAGWEGVWASGFMVPELLAFVTLNVGAGRVELDQATSSVKKDLTRRQVLLNRTS